jgi:5-methylcytosine-specific restriction endonuclease McrA
LGDKSSLEIILILLQKELSNAKLRHQVRKTASNSRYIPKHIKQKVYTGECANCGVQYNLEYDHIKKYSHGGLTSVENLQILCRNCNQRKEIKARQTKFFA